jgi:hypothetical protein
MVGLRENELGNQKKKKLLSPQQQKFRLYYVANDTWQNG